MDNFGYLEWYQLVAPSLENLMHLPGHPFATTVSKLEYVALLEFDRQIAECSLHYHNRDHVIAVKRRAEKIFQAVLPYLNIDQDLEGLSLLLNLCATTHDLIQVFIPQVLPHGSRQREAGVSEAATITILLDIIHQLQQQDPEIAGNGAVQFTTTDYDIIQEAIAATVCDYDPQEQAIFQPLLYRTTPPITLIARILALADLGSLGMEGIESYHAEGRLLFLEENPDVYLLMVTGQLEDLLTTQPALAENVRQRLLKRAKFQVNLAKSRLRRLPQELTGLPLAAISHLTKQVFPYLTIETIREIELITPTDEDTSLTTLLTFFQFDYQVQNSLQDLVFVC